MRIEPISQCRLLIPHLPVLAGPNIHHQIMVTSIAGGAWYGASGWRIETPDAVVMISQDALDREDRHRRSIARTTVQPLWRSTAGRRLT